jgi:hypothetical protein
MLRWALGVALVGAVGFSDGAAAKATNRRLPPALPPVQLSEAGPARADTLVADRRATRENLPADERDDLDRLSAHVRDVLFADEIRDAKPGAWDDARQAVISVVAVLMLDEYRILAAYATDAIAAHDDGMVEHVSTVVDPRTEARLHLQDLQMVPMQVEVRSHARISAISKTGHKLVRAVVGTL